MKFCIQRRNIQEQTSAALLQRFLPEDEPEPSWDHSPEFLTEDANDTWIESLDVRENLDYALKPRNLFAVTESISDSLTSSDSEDNLFTDSSATVNPNRNHMVRDDKHRRCMRKGRRQSLTLPTTQSQNTEDMDTM